MCSVNVWIRESDIELISGDLTICTYKHNGQELERTICKHCSTTLWFRSASDKTILNVQGGTLKTPVPPIAHLWVSSADPWLQEWLNGLDGQNSTSVTVYQNQPTSPSVITDLWDASRGYQP